MLGEICIIRARMAAMRENAALTTELSNRALDLLPEDELHLRGDVALDLGHAYCSVGDIESASKRSPGPPSAVLPTTSGRPCSPSGTRPHRDLQGRTPTAEELLLDGQRLAESRPEGVPSVAGIIHTGMGELLYERGDLDEARRLLEEGIEHGRRSGEAKILVYGYVNLARVLMAEGDAEGLTPIREAGGLTPRWPLIWAWQARFWLAQGDVGRRRVGAGVRGDRGLHELPTPLREDHDGPRVTRGGQDRRGLDSLGNLLAGARSEGRRAHEIELLVLLAPRPQRTGRHGRRWASGRPSRWPNRRDSCASSSMRGCRWRSC